MNLEIKRKLQSLPPSLISNSKVQRLTGSTVYRQRLEVLVVGGCLLNLDTVGVQHVEEGIMLELTDTIAVLTIDMLQSLDLLEAHWQLWYKQSH